MQNKYLIAINHPNHYLTRQASKVIIKINESPNIDLTTDMLWNFIPNNQQFIIKSEQSTDENTHILCSEQEISNSLVNPNHWSLKITNQFQEKPCLWNKNPISNGYQLSINQDWILNEAIINNELRPVLAHRSTIKPATIFITDLELVIGERNIILDNNLLNYIGKKSSIENLPYTNINFGNIGGSAILGGNNPSSNMYVLQYNLTPNQNKEKYLINDNFINIKHKNNYWTHITNFIIIILLLLILIMLPKLNKK